LVGFFPELEENNFDRGVCTQTAKPLDCLFITHISYELAANDCF
jgi:hypothetical protein